MYVGQPIAVHFPLHEAVTLQGAHFQRWFSLWAEAVDELFAGPMAIQAKRRAAIIAESMQYRLGVASDDVAVQRRLPRGAADAATVTAPPADLTFVRTSRAAR